MGGRVVVAVIGFYLIADIVKFNSQVIRSTIMFISMMEKLTFYLKNSTPAQSQALPPSKRLIRLLSSFCCTNMSMSNKFGERPETESALYLRCQIDPLRCSCWPCYTSERIRESFLILMYTMKTALVWNQLVWNQLEPPPWTD